MIDNEKSEILRRTSFLLAVLVLASIMLPGGVFHASAGSPDEPEVSDNSGDADPAVPGSEFCDIISAYIDVEDASIFRVNIGMAAVPTATEDAALVLAFGPSWIFGFICNGTQYTAVAGYSANGYTFSLTGGDLDKEPVPGSVDGSASTISMTIQKNLTGALPGANISEIYAEVTGKVTDRAPDSGYGRDYTLMTYEANITLSARPAIAEAKAGGETGFSITMLNSGNVGANVSVSAVVDDESAASGWKAELESKNVFVEGNGSRETVVLAVFVPENAQAGEECAITVVAADSVINLTAVVKGAEPPTLQSDVASNSKGVAPGGSVDFTIYVTNNDADAQSFDLEAAASGDGWECSFDPNPLEVAGKNWAETRLTVRAPPDASDSCVVAVSCSGAVLELTVNVAGWENGDTDSGGSGFLGLPGFGLPSLLVTLVAMVLCIRRRPDEG